MPYRFLIRPRPVTTYSVGIVLDTIARELDRRGYETTSALYNYCGVSLKRWDASFMFGAPRFAFRTAKSGLPSTLTMGRPYDEWEQKMRGRSYDRCHESQKRRFLELMLRCDKVVFNSQFTLDSWKAIFESRGVPFPAEEKYRVIFHPVDISEFSPSPFRPERPFTIAAFGAFRTSGRLSTVFEVSRMLRFEHRILVAGTVGGPCEEELRSAMQDATLAERTSILGWVPHDGLAACYRQADCLVHAMHGESFCLVAAEAMACGVPVIVPEYGAPKEFVRSGGMVVRGKPFAWDSEQVEQVANAVEFIRENREELSASARKTVCDAVSSERIAARYLEFMGLPPFWRHSSQASKSARVKQENTCIEGSVGKGGWRQRVNIA